MRIGRIVLDHFGPYENADVAIDESMAIFVAQNASGKSKLAQAATARGMTARGRGIRSCSVPIRPW